MKKLLAWPLFVPLFMLLLVGGIPNLMAIAYQWADNTISGENEESNLYRYVNVMRTGIFLILFVMVITLLAVK